MSSSMKQPQYSFNRQHLLRNGKPFLPTMGEFHYARYPRAEWRRELQKMKALGVDIAATYVFWNQHEAEEGVFDFTGCRDVGAFLRLCGEEGLQVFLRIGPWCHGESRHGGFPEWLMQKGIPLRTTDESYMQCVRRLWEALYAQVKDSLYAAGGPVIGIQLENEFGHCGGDGTDAHMEALLHLAQEIGYDAPYFTATGWGGARIGPMLPVMGCYCDAPWDRRLAPLPPSPNYIFSHERNDVDVGSDFRRGANVTFDEDAYPYLLAEMGGGINSTFHRRPTAIPADTGAMALTKLGSGANLVGYYMYHGGTNPGPELNETRESGSWCETPTLSYAPNSPIGEYGQIGELAREVKLLAMFTGSYGEQLAPMPCEIPEGTAKRSADAEHPRYSWRRGEHGGFLFINNHQRGMQLPPRKIAVEGFGTVNVPSGWYGVLPVDLPVGGAVLRSAKASPLCILDGRKHVFYADGDPAYDWAGEPEAGSVVTITRREALDAWRVDRGGRQTLIISEAPVIADEMGYLALARRSFTWRDVLTGETGRIDVPDAKPTVTVKRTDVNYQCYTYELDLHYDGPADETYLRVAYEGSLAEIYVDGRKVADHIYDGATWELALNRFGKPAHAVLRVYALFEGMPVWLQQPPRFEDGRALRLNEVRMENEYAVRLFENVEDA